MNPEASTSQRVPSSLDSTDLLDSIATPGNGNGSSARFDLFVPSTSTSNLMVDRAFVADPFASSGNFSSFSASNPQPALVDLAQASMEDMSQPRKRSVQSAKMLQPGSANSAGSPALSAESASSPQTPQSTRLAPVPAHVSPLHFNLPTRRWTDPLVFSDIPLVDQLGETINKAFSHQPSNQRPQRHLLSVAKAVESNPDQPYAPLIASNSWKAVAQLARNDLISTHPTQVEDIMMLWFIRWSALLKLKQYDIIIGEVEKLKATDLAALDYSQHADIFPNQTGTMLSFDLLVLMAKLPAAKGNPHETIHCLCVLLYPQKPCDFKPTRFQHYRIMLHVVSILLEIPDIPLALSMLKDVIEEFPTNLDLLSAKGRLELQLGDVASSITTFQKVEELVGLTPFTDLDFPRLPSHPFPRPELIMSHRAFLLFAHDKFAEAIGYLSDLLVSDPDSCAAMNNLAMCHLYSGNVGQGSSFLESFLVTHPEKGGTMPELMFNLVSMFDLTDSSLAKKRALLKIIIQGCGDNFDTDCMKL